MGIYYRYATALIALFVFSLPAFSTERVKVNPYIKAGPATKLNQLANGSPIAGFVPTKDNATLLLEAEKKGWLGDTTKKTAITVKAKIKVPISGIGGKLKNIVKANPAQLALRAATATAVAGVGWVMTDGVLTKKKEVAVPPAGVDDYAWRAPDIPNLNGQLFPSPGATCSAIAERGFTSGGVPVPGSVVSLTRASDTSWNCTVLTPFGYNSTRPVTRNGTACPSGSQWNTSQGVCTKIEDAPVTEADHAQLDTYLGAAGAVWLRDLLQDVCELSNNPQGCYDDLQKQSPPSISGPASVVGPTSTTTGTYTRPDGSTGTTGTTSQTNFNIRYGDNYFDYDTVTTNTTTRDGEQVSQDTTTDEGVPEETPPEEGQEEEQYSFDDTDLPEVEPFYEQKYPDGFQGVWNEAKSDFDNSEFLSFLQSFVPSFSGTCPSWSMNFAIGAMANFGTIPFATLCYVFDFIKVIVLVTAAFTCRAIIFGG